MFFKFSRFYPYTLPVYSTLPLQKLGVETLPDRQGFLNFGKKKKNLNCTIMLQMLDMHHE